ncbi:MAG: response regulator [Oscillospiraceae bacterium]|nr:response regulator [Oscillospiraceae bacterium]
MDSFGQRIREQRAKKGLTQNELADLMFVSRKTISNWEVGLRMPDITMLIRLAKCLDVETYELFVPSSQENSPPTVIIVEDEPVLLSGFMHIINEVLPEVQSFGFISGEETLRFAGTTQVDVAFLDIELFGESGIDLARKLMALNPSVNIIFLTGHSEYTASALELHCSGYIMKPLTPEKIKTEIAHLRFPVKGLE